MSMLSEVFDTPIVSGKVRADAMSGVALNYSDDQPRDEGGRWTSGGGGGFAKPNDTVLYAQRAEHPAELNVPHIVKQLDISEMVPTEPLGQKQRENAEDLARLEAEYRTNPSSVPPPIGYSNEDGEFVIIEGHRRYMAAKAAGIKKLWVVQTYLDKAEESDPRAVRP